MGDSIDMVEPQDAAAATPRDADRSSTPARAWMRALEATARAADDPRRTLPIVIGELGQTLGDKPALLSDRETMSFAALAQRMNGYSRWAIAEGVKPGVSVCLLMPNRPEYLAIWLGVTQKRSAGDERHPVGPFEARGALDAAASRETIGETLMPAAQNIHAKRLARAKRSEGRGREGDAHDQGRRFERQRA